MRFKCYLLLGESPERKKIIPDISRLRFIQIACALLRDLSSYFYERRLFFEKIRWALPW